MTSATLVVLSALLTITFAQRRTLSDVEYYCGNKPADVVFLLDVSNSIWGPDFQTQLDFVREVIEMFEIRENTTRVGVATFSSHVYREFHLNRYFDKRSVSTAISRIRQRQGYTTNTGLAIWHMRKRMFSSRHGSRSGVAKVGIVLTDGQSRSIGKTVYEAFRAKMEKIHMFAIGIGNRINKRELKGIASEPASEYMFEVEGYSALDAIKHTLAVRTCKVTRPTTTTTTTTSTTTTTTTPTTTTTSIYDTARLVCSGRRADVVFALDSSDSISDADLERQAQFLTRVVDSMDVSPETTRVGSIRYSDQIQSMFELNEYDSQDGVSKGLLSLGMTAGTGRVDLALKHILTKSFRRSMSRRKTTQVGVIITGSPSRYLELSKHIARKSTYAGVQYIAIGVGNDVDGEELNIIAGTNDGHHVFKVASFEDLNAIIPQVAIQLCEVATPLVAIEDQACGARQEADVMFLMDNMNAGRRNTKTALAFLKALVDELDVDSDNIHVGLMSAECEPDVPGFTLGSHSSRQAIQRSVDEMKPTNVYETIHTMRRRSFSESAGGRKHAKKVAILIIDGSLEDPIKTLTEAQRAKIHGVEVFVIQVGSEEPQEEVLMMCDDPTNQHFYQVRHYDELLKLKDRLLEALCDEL